LIKKRMIKIAGTEGISGYTSSLSLSKQTTKADMMPCSQGRAGTSFDGGNFGSEMDFSVWSEIPCTQSNRRKAGGCIRASASS
jgi:hypothetical protein